MSPLKHYSDIWKPAGGILIVAVYFQRWELFTHHPVRGQKAELPLRTLRAEHPKGSWQEERDSQKK